MCTVIIYRHYYCIEKTIDLIGNFIGKGAFTNVKSPCVGIFSLICNLFNELKNIFFCLLHFRKHLLAAPTISPRYCWYHVNFPFRNRANESLHFRRGPIIIEPLYLKKSLYKRIYSIVNSVRVGQEIVKKNL